MFKLPPLSIIAALLVSGHAMAADSPLPLEVVQPERVVGVMKENFEAGKQAAPLPVNVPDEQALLLQMAQQNGQKLPADQAPPDYGNVADQWAEQVKQKYAPEQKMTVRPGGNVMVPVALGLMNRIETNFKSVSVKSSDEQAVLEVDGGILYATLNSRNPVGLILMEEGVPESAINVTAVPVDVPPALVRVTVPLTMTQRQDAAVHQRKAFDEQATEKALEEEEQIMRSDRHTERLKEIMLTTALGQVPAGFTMSEDDINVLPSPYQSPCRFPMANKLGQRMVGAREFIDVVLVSNTTGYPSSIKEELCMGKDTLAVGVMDAATLRPGAKTEVYIVRNKLWAKQTNALQTRPRLDGNGSMGIGAGKSIDVPGSSLDTTKSYLK